MNPEISNRVALLRARRSALLRLAAVALAPALATGAVRAQQPAPGRAPPADTLAPMMAGERTALVIGNSRYAQGTLKNPANDARLMARTLTQLGYSVTMLEDARLAMMVDAARQWVGSGAAAASRVFYFSGHGLQAGGRNYLLPVDASLQSEEDLPAQAFNAADLVDRLSRNEKGVSLVVLDACRNLPPMLLANARRTRGATDGGGLAPLQAPRGTVVAYSTAPGSVAADGAGQANSAYTRHLAEAMLVQGLSIEAMFKRVRAAVLEETRNAQMPWEASSLVGEFCFRPAKGGAC